MRATSPQNAPTATLVLEGRPFQTTVADGTQTAEGGGLEGNKVESVMLDKPPKRSVRIFIKDESGNAVLASPEEMLAALRQAAPDYEITVVKKAA
jgi:hypothetical protein